MRLSHGSMVLEADDLKIGIDAPLGDVLYVSHAHCDHLFGTTRRKGIIASDETFALGSLDSSKKMAIEGTHLENAGHILGSTQLVADTDDGRLVYTGDFKLKDGLIKGAPVIESDILIIESTYGAHQYAFPDVDAVWKQMIRWVQAGIKNNNSILLGGYSVGKAQEIIDVLNKNDIVPVVHDRVEHFCGIYDSFGCRTRRIPVSSNEGMEQLDHGFVGIVPQHLLSAGVCNELSALYGRKVFSAAVTGQHMFRPLDVHEIFPVSDHANFNELLEYIEGSSPKKIYCTHGSKELFANELRKRGYDAEPVQTHKVKNETRSRPGREKIIQTALAVSSV